MPATAEIEVRLADCASDSDILDRVSSSSSVPLSAHAASAVVDGQVVTFNDFYAEHFRFVWRNARHLVGFDSAVDDLVQEVFVIAMRRLPEFEGRSPVRSWLYGIVRRVVSDHRRSLRRRNVRDSVDLEEMEGMDSGPHRKAEKAEALHLLYELLDKLDDDKREVFVLVEIEHLTGVQIAEVIGVSSSTVEGRLRDARKELAAIAQRYKKQNDARLDARPRPRPAKGAS